MKEVHDPKPAVYPGGGNFHDGNDLNLRMR